MRSGQLFAAKMDVNTRGMQDFVKMIARILIKRMNFARYRRGLSCPLPDLIRQRPLGSDD